MTGPGGYDDGYEACACFWGREPGSLVAKIVADAPGGVSGWAVLDVGCGEGKNAAFLGERGATVRAIDVSPAAIRNARSAWPTAAGVTFEVGDVRTMEWPVAQLDLVVAYGVLHCFPDEATVRGVVAQMQRATRPGGTHAVCAFNDRLHDLSGHPGFRPVLLSHAFYRSLYEGWFVLHETDEDLLESHPTNGIPHVHSMTRLVARRPTHGTI